MGDVMVDPAGNITSERPAASALLGQYHANLIAQGLTEGLVHAIVLDAAVRMHTGEIMFAVE